MQHVPSSCAGCAHAWYFDAQVVEILTASRKRKGKWSNEEQMDVLVAYWSNCINGTKGEITHPKFTDKAVARKLEELKNILPAEARKSLLAV